MSRADAETLAFYQREAARYTLSFADGPHAELDSFLDRLPGDAHILELGCGGGRDAAHMIARGFAVDPTDGSAAMAKKAEQRLGRPVKVMAFEQLDAVETYDAVWAHASLLHAPRETLPEILGRIHAALRPGGWHFANYKTGDGEARDRFGRYYNRPDREELEQLYRAAGDWRLYTLETYRAPGWENEQSDWLAITLQKTSVHPEQRTD